METGERDSTQDWLLPGGSRPPLLSELEDRIDEALAIARTSEEAVKEVGEMVLDAARQAHRAADLAESASVSALASSHAALTASRAAQAKQAGAGWADGGSTPDTGAAASKPATEDADLRRFTVRADLVVARLRALERVG